MGNVYKVVPCITTEKASVSDVLTELKPLIR